MSAEEISCLVHGSRLRGLNVEVVGGGEAAIIVSGIVQVVVLISIFDLVEKICYV